MLAMVEDMTLSFESFTKKCKDPLKFFCRAFLMMSLADLENSSGPFQATIISSDKADGVKLDL